MGDDLGSIDPGTGLRRSRRGDRVAHPADCKFCALGYPIDDRAPEHHINPATKIWPIEEWGSACARGFVRDERFAGQSGAQVIPGTNRNTTRKWRDVGTK